LGTRITTDEGVAAIYDSVTGLPIPTPVFDSSDEAQEFLDFCEDCRFKDPRSMDYDQLQNARRKFHEAQAAVEQAARGDR
jgi:hypothetical protein